MLRLNKEYRITYLKSGDYFIPEKKNGEKLSTDTKEYINKIKSRKTYIDFLDAIKTTTYEREESTYSIFEGDKSFYIFKSYYALSSIPDQFYFVCKYTPENDELYKFTRKLLRMDDTKHCTQINSNLNNHFNFIVSTEILGVLYAKHNIISRGEKVFIQFKKKSKNGKIRDIVAPHPEIKEALQKLNTLLQKTYDKRNESFQVAYKKGKNVKSGAAIHKDDKYVFNLDLHDFYPSCKRELVKKYTDFLFDYSFNRELIESEFLDTILINDGLFIGSPISGTLANVIISNPVKFMNNMCRKYEMHLSVYADDISMSSNKRISKDFAYAIFNQAFCAYQLDSYFKLNEKKSVGFTGCNRKVTGVSINDSNKISVPRKYYRNLRILIDHLDKGDSTINIRALQGKIAYACMIDETGRIYKYLKKYEPTVQKYNLCSKEKMDEMKNKLGL